MIKRYVLVIACLGGFWLAFACAYSNGSNPLALYPATPEGLTALLRGRLEVDDGCLYITDEHGERWLAAFPSPGTSWDAEGQSVRVGDKVLRIGATGEFGGGELNRGPSGIQWVQAPRAECDSSRIWLVTRAVER